MTRIDTAHAHLKSLGWSIGDMAYRDGERVVWQVYCHRGEERIVTRAPTQTQAWEAAEGWAIVACALDIIENS